MFFNFRYPFFCVLNGRLGRADEVARDFLLKNHLHGLQLLIQPLLCNGPENGFHLLLIRFFHSLGGWDGDQGIQIIQAEQPGQLHLDARRTRGIASGENVGDRSGRRQDVQHGRKSLAQPVCNPHLPTQPVHQRTQFRLNIVRNADHHVLVR
ncbi:MAG: hypothetical protein B6245_24355 [Desulfobacteraceae bacterium 4572_88]|nr:MAG: hypothetical protein B6245_24355 [Desulfobacteraceae bacterium 4572_88]